MLTLKNFSLVHHEKTFLKKSNFSFPPLMVLIGSSGEGKTTFLQTLALLKKPTTGEILLNDKHLEQHQVGLLLQNFGLFSHLSVLENLTLPLKLKKKNFDQLDYYVSLFRLQFCLTKKPKELSGGEKQRVALIRMLLLDPEVLLYDEPTASLDEYFKIVLIQLLNSFKNKTQIIISHDLYFAQGLHCPIYELKKGEILQETFKQL